MLCILHEELQMRGLYKEGGGATSVSASTLKIFGGGFDGRHVGHISSRLQVLVLVL